MLYLKRNRSPPPVFPAWLYYFPCTLPHPLQILRSHADVIAPRRSCAAQPHSTRHPAHTCNACAHCASSGVHNGFPHHASNAHGSSSTQETRSHPWAVPRQNYHPSKTPVQDFQTDQPNLYCGASAKWACELPPRSASAPHSTV